MWKKQLLEQGADLFAKNKKGADTTTQEHERKQSKLYEKIGQLTEYGRVKELRKAIGLI